MDINTQKSSFMATGKGNTLGKLAGLFSTGENLETNVSTIKDMEIIGCIRDAKSEWLEARTNFEYADEQELVDYYTYKIKACEVRYEYYLKKAKQLGVKSDTIEQMGLLIHETARSGSV